MSLTQQQEEFLLSLTPEQIEGMLRAMKAEAPAVKKVTHTYHGQKVLLTQTCALCDQEFHSEYHVPYLKLGDEEPRELHKTESLFGCQECEVRLYQLNKSLIIQKVLNFTMAVNRVIADRRKRG